MLDLLRIQILQDGSFSLRKHTIRFIVCEIHTNDTTHAHIHTNDVNKTFNQPQYKTILCHETWT